MGDHCPRSDALLRSTQEPWGPRPLGDRRWRLRALDKAQGLCPWWENQGATMTEMPATLHPSVPAPLSRHPALAHRCLGSHVDSHHFLPVQGMLSWGPKEAPLPLQGCVAGCGPCCPSRPGTHCPGGPGLSGTIFISWAPAQKPCQTQGWFSVHLHMLESQN